MAYGQVGLAEAAKQFDPSRGSRFSTYAYYRIRGAIYDGMSKMAWCSRSQYRRVRTEQMANEVLCDGSKPSEKLPERTAEGDMRWFRDLTKALTVVHLTTLAAEQDGTGESMIADSSAPEPSAVVSGREICQILNGLIDELPEAAGNLIRDTYFKGLTLQEAGDKLGVSKSWTSRLHARTLQRLARSLRQLDAVP